MDALFELDQFEETRVVWEPVWEPEIEDFGWHWAEEGMRSDLPRRKDDSKITKDEWRRFLSSARCRDCGRSCAMNQGGAAGGKAFRVCDECAQLDHCTTRKHDRGPEWHVSHWGESHRSDEHDQLIAAQQKRRAAYLRKVAAS
ncbi:hypothetical protein K8F61_05260 [Microbacterium resistens]|uniref:Uncharacterized protein n=1 Tax=Microbacterium resistens TaxID=156977 RepID=A0ABY3RU49_9MICO|nr:hypothetical protein [Microbacterium resistens]UGS27598.1 hypothetical protein K8F61_05260 [Microbacterium resistens]